VLLHVVARGKIARSPESDLVDRYAKRIAWPIKLTELPESGGRVPDPQTPCRMILLDERGDNLSSAELAALLENWRDHGTRETRFVIGAADGHEREERDAADRLLSFGKATWPHLLVRAMLLEQLFRATSILAGHPYHRAG
jgi:23S rRNA (pseudouridine1915-N3)-methyltransferase